MGAQGKIIIVFLGWLVLQEAGCASLPDQSSRAPSHKHTDTATTALALRFQQDVAAHPGHSGVYPLAIGSEAFLARVALIKLAEKSLDLQYYIWRRDTTGLLLAAYLLEAAERGVRVRLLLDDLGSPLGDDALILMSLHPNIEVRLFNPVASRTQRLLSMITDFGRVNRRMHNKSLTADNTLAVLGGRNIGNEYFDANDEVGFADLDVLAVGPVVDEVTDSFDLYWNYPASYPIESLSGRTLSEAETAQAREEAARLKADSEASDYARQVRLLEFLQNPQALQWYWGVASLVYDHPAKADGSIDASQRLLGRMRGIIDEVQSELIIVSPYFVPGEKGVAYLGGLAGKGIKVMVVTNSLAATDVGIVHSGYARYRHELVKSGVWLYEMRPDAKRVQPKTEATNKTTRDTSFIGDSARASLHAKAFFIDRRTTFIGSLNLDPRSVLINTEVGVVIDNEDLAATASDSIQAVLRDNAFQVLLDEEGELFWLGHDEGVATRYETEPLVSAWRRFGVWFLGLLPLESQL